MVDVEAVLGLLGAGIITLSACYYLFDVLRGQTRPQRTSWGVWAAVGILGYGTSEAGGAGPGAWSTGVDSVACVVTFLISLHPRYGKPGGRRLDPVLGAIAITGVALWRWGPLTDTGAALCAVGCDVIALWPTLREAWRQPSTESLPSWSADLVGHVLCLAAVSRWTVAALAFPVYMVLGTALVSALLVWRRHAGRHDQRDRTDDIRRFGPIDLSCELGGGPGDGVTVGRLEVYGNAGTVSRSDLLAEGGAT